VFVALSTFCQPCERNGTLKSFRLWAAVLARRVGRPEHRLATPPQRSRRKFSRRRATETAEEFYGAISK